MLDIDIYKAGNIHKETNEAGFILSNNSYNWNKLTLYNVAKEIGISTSQLRQILFKYRVKINSCPISIYHYEFLYLNDVISAFKELAELAESCAVAKKTL